MTEQAALQQKVREQAYRIETLEKIKALDTSIISSYEEMVEALNLRIKLLEDEQDEANSRANVRE